MRNEWEFVPVGLDLFVNTVIKILKAVLQSCCQREMNCI